MVVGETQQKISGYGKSFENLKNNRGFFKGISVRFTIYFFLVGKGPFILKQAVHCRENEVIMKKDKSYIAVLWEKGNKKICMLLIMAKKLAPNFLFRLCMDDCDDGDDDLRYQQPFCTISPFLTEQNKKFILLSLSLTFSFHSFLAQCKPARERKEKDIFIFLLLFSWLSPVFVWLGDLASMNRFFLWCSFAENVPHALLFPAFHQNIQFSRERRNVYF